LVNAFYQGNRVELDPGLQGVTYFIPTLVVPLLLVTHVLVFKILLRRGAVADEPGGEAGAHGRHVRPRQI